MHFQQDLGLDADGAGHEVAVGRGQRFLGRDGTGIELLLAHSAGYVELFYGGPLNQSSWELATDALARSKSGVLVGGAKRLYGIIENGDLAYVEERVDADGGLTPHLSARLARFVG